MSDNEVAPALHRQVTARDLAHREGALWTSQSLEHPAHPYTEDQDDTVEAHYSSLERPCACYSGWVFVGYADEYGEEKEAPYRCRRCAESRRPTAGKTI